MKLDLLTNATVVDDAIRFVEQSKEENKQHKRTDYNNGEDRELANQVF